MIREARALGVSLALHGAVLTGVFCVCGGAGPGAAEHPRVIDLRLLEPEIARAAAPAAVPAAPTAPRPRSEPTRPPAPPPPTEPTVQPVATPSPSPAPAPDAVAEAPAPELAQAPPSVPPEDLDAAPARVVASVALPAPADGGGQERPGGGVAGTTGFAAATGTGPAVGSDLAGNAESGAAAPAEVPAAAEGGPPPGGAVGGVPRDLAALREIVQRSLVYPSLARRMGWEGRVTLSFIVCRDGRAREVAVLESSGREVLDRHAVESVQKISGLPASTTEAKVIVPVVYRLQ